MRHVSRIKARSHSIFAALDLMRADSLASYRQALSQWAIPTVNALYAGVDAATGEDHIAYHALLAIPQRPLHLHGALDVTGRYPQDGSSTQSDWGPILDLDWNPHVIDPAQGYILNGNSLAVGAWYDDFVYAGIGGNGDTYRSLQIRKELEALFANATTVSERALHQLHVNAESWATSQYLEILKDLKATGVIPAYDPSLLPTTRSEKAARVLRGLRRWSTEGRGLLDQRSVGAPLADDVLRAMSINARSEPFSCSWGGAEGGASFFLKAYADDPTVLGRTEINTALDIAADAWDDITSTYPGERDPTIYSNDVDSWTGRSTPLPTTMGYQRNFMCFWSSQGSCSTNASMEVPVELNQYYIPTINSASGSSYPLSVLFHDIDKSRALLPPGNSERPSSRFSLDALRAITAKGNGNITSIPLAPLSPQGRRVTSQTSLYFP
jgi:hypothetical protein